MSSSKQNLARRRAADRIAQNKRTQDKSLDLSNCELTEVPAQVSDLVWLESLRLADNSHLTDLSPLAGLRSLQDLNITSTAVSDLSPLAGLSALATLDRHEAQVSDLSPLAGLSGLRSLCAFKNKISDVSALAGMPALEALLIYSNAGGARTSPS
jgi:internalin A